MRQGFITGFLRHRYRVAAVAGAATLLVVGLVLNDNGPASANKQVTLKISTSASPQQSKASASTKANPPVATVGGTDGNSATEFNAISEDDLQVPQTGDSTGVSDDNGPDWQTYTVNRGDSFSSILSGWSVPYTTVLALLKAAPSKSLLTNLQPGDEMEYQQDGDGKLLSLRIPDGRAKNYLFTRKSGGNFAFEEIKKPVIHYREYYAGTLHGTLAESAKKAGLPSGVAAEFIKLMGDRIDFRRQARPGDTFALLIDREWLNGKPLDQEKILVAEYNGKKVQLTAIRAKNGNYYTPKGKGLALAFMRHPFYRHYRISSPFNLRRVNPVTHRVEPHLGTDFAMPTGSAVRAPADGVVVKTGFQRYAGNYVVIQHSRKFQTRYFHLSHILVHRGEKVKMGEEVALSGNTGRTTGPHLHYEVRVYGKAVNAMHVHLPTHNHLSGKQLAHFESHSKTLLAQLSKNVGVMLASNDHGHSIVRAP